MRTMTTLIAVVGSRAEPALRAAAEHASNLTIENLDPLPDDPLARATTIARIWERAARHGSVYTGVATDPLAAVVREWARRLRGEEHELETMIGLVGDAPPPDYWLVDDRLGEPEIHWYTEHLAGQAAGRIILTRLDPRSITEHIGALPTGPEPEPLRAVAEGARGYVPTGLLSTESTKIPMPLSI